MFSPDADEGFLKLKEYSDFHLGAPGIGKCQYPQARGPGDPWKNVTFILLSEAIDKPHLKFLVVLGVFFFFFLLLNCFITCLTSFHFTERTRNVISFFRCVTFLWW